MAQNKPRIGWIGMGRMGYPMAERLLKAGYDVSIWNRTRSKAEPLAKIGGKVVDNLFDLKDVDVLFSIVSTGKDLDQVYFGKNSVTGHGGKVPRSSWTARPSRWRNPPRSATVSASSAASSSRRR